MQINSSIKSGGTNRSAVRSAELKSSKNCKKTNAKSANQSAGSKRSTISII